MEITTQLSLKDYRKWTVQSAIRQPVFWVVMSIGISVVLFNVLSKTGSRDNALYYTSLAFITIYLVTIFFGIKEKYQSHPTLGERIKFQFLEDKLYTKGESFESLFTCSKLYKVEIAGDFLLIYYSNRIGNVIPIRDVQPHDLPTLKEILDRNGVKNNLKLN